VYLAIDTRSSSIELLEATIEGIEILNGKYKNFGLLTTPILHFMIDYDNKNKLESENENVYYETLSKAYINLIKEKKLKKCIVDW
jgi:hypothetical protein